MITFLLCSLLFATPQAENEETRGIGQYPGAPSEYFAPTVSWTDGGGTLTNVALHRAAYASSARDYNHTAHLVTDGICDTQEPAVLTVCTPAGQLPRREAEWAIDGGPFSRNILMGEKTWLQYHWGGTLTPVVRKVKVNGMVAYDDKVATKGYRLCCQASDDGQQWQTIGELKGKGLPGTPLHYKLHSDPNKQEAQDYLPARVLSEEIRLGATDHCLTHFRLLLEMEGAAHWDIRELQFSDAADNDVEVLPSRQFSSLWMSNGGGEQWIYVDLGRSLPLERIVLDWYQAPAKGCIQVSDDARTWKTVADIAERRFTATGRYVRLLMQQTGEAGYYALREMEVLSRQKVVYTPHRPAPAVKGRRELSGGEWQLQRASEVTAAGEQIASADFAAEGWIPATVPGTVLASYMNIGAVPNPNYADNIDQLSESFFRSNFWYRNEFQVGSELDGQQQWLNFDGINWKANVFLNGQRLGRVEGAFMRGRFNVTGLLRQGTNYLAVEIICNEHFAAIKEKDEQSTQFNGGILGADNPTFHATVGWDWITTIRGREAGIWNEVYLTATKMVTVSDPYVQTVVGSGKVSVTPSVFVRNNDSRPVSGVLSGYIGDVRFEKRVSLPAHAEQEVSFSPDEFPQLSSDAFRLWWPNGYGEPYLYEAGSCFDGDTPLTYKAGLRQLTYTDQNDSLRIYVNGRRFIPLGGNWGFDEHNLLYRSREYDIAVGYHRDMNFTMIRNWVGQVGDEAFYEACDRHGIMIWQDFWLANPADGPDPYDNVLFLANARDYTRRMRSHASIGLYCGRNEGFPPEALDRKLRAYVHELAPGMEYISHSSSQGVSGGGPYRALTMKEYFERQSGKIHSERGMPNVMNIESLQRTFSPDALWPQSLQWGQHDFTLQGAQRAATFNKMVEEGFGKAASAAQFSRWAQLINYNGYRGMFEATSRTRAGLLLWMSHPCWPSMVWQTYDYYFEPTAAYFGCKKACEPLHIQYNALTDSIEVVNHSAGNRQTLTATAVVYNLNGKQVARKKHRFNSSEDTTEAWLRLADLTPRAPSDVYYLRLTLTDPHGLLSENTYIMGREEGNYRALATLPEAEVEVTTVATATGSLTVVLRNRSKVPAPFVRLNLKGADGEQILPAVYSDNYITLMPGERKRVSVTWNVQDARGQQAHIEVTP
ncbi:MAG: discoidin domain-containing protein [Prevotella sp.]|nr:discoidin domain-containing protein [Prevotella sp.]